MAWIREYWAEKYTGADYTARVWVGDSKAVGLTKCTPLPTLEEVSGVLGEEIRYLRLNRCFYFCYDLLASPRIDFPYVSYVREAFLTNNYSSLRIAPTFVNNTVLGAVTDGMFQNCTNLISPPTIQDKKSGRWSLSDLFNGCASLPYPVSIPTKTQYIDGIFNGCANISGEMIIRPTSFSSAERYNLALKDTTKPITIYGDRTLCEAIAATANNGNASWAAWYDPVPAVTDRGQGSYTTADDMTRMVRNGALAVSSYAPARMVYHQGDIVRADEWQALVEAAQTIDSSITTSTNYANLNRIEAAFDSAL